MYVCDEEIKPRHGRCKTFWYDNRNSYADFSKWCHKLLGISSMKLSHKVSSEHNSGNVSVNFTGGMSDLR
jgi:hypothetical protein